MPSNKYEKQRARRAAAQRAASYQQRKLHQSQSQLRVVLTWLSILVVVAMIVGLVLVAGSSTTRPVVPTNNSGSGIFTYIIMV